MKCGVCSGPGSRVRRGQYPELPPHTEGTVSWGLADTALRPEAESLPCQASDSEKAQLEPRLFQFWTKVRETVHDRSRDAGGERPWKELHLTCP